MRPLEILLSFANLLVFCILAIPQLPAIPGIGYLALIAVLIAAIQMLVEGPRWQMVPSYALAGLFSLVWLLRNFVPTGGIKGQIVTNPFGIGLAVGLSILGLAASITLPTVLPVFHFPRPSGPYQIGTLTYHWVDTSRHEIFSADPNVHRELMAQVWYPAKRNSSSERASYVQDAGALSPALARLAGWPGFALKHLKYVTTNVSYFSPLAPRLGFAGPIDAQRAYDIVNAFSLAFFDLHLQGRPSTLLDEPTKQYPEVLFEFDSGQQLNGVVGQQKHA